MPKIKLPRSSPSIDMTPMVDLGFLLVTFFMLTTQFRAQEPVEADTPSSISEIKIPEKDMMILTVDKNNHVFYTFDGQDNRRAVLTSMSGKYAASYGDKVQFSEEEIKTFSNMTSFGVPLAQMKELLDEEAGAEGELKKNQPGIPIDSLNNELNDWIYFSRITNPRYRVAIKGDREASYETIKKLIKTLGDNKVYKFNLVTDMKTE